MAARKIPYVNKFNGNVLVVTKQEAKKLNEDWERVEFTVNQEGERVMRIHLNGATVDVSENKDQKAVVNGLGSTK
jgi:hypothetical protein